MSNLAFFHRYTDTGKIYGVSGTLGTKSEQAFLKRHCPVDLVPVPTARSKRFFEIDGIVTRNKEEWLDTVCDIIQRELNPKSFGVAGRAALIICEDISSAVEIGAALNGLKQNTPIVHMYTRSNEAEKQIISRILDSNEVIVATNLAGRGSDIQVSKNVVQSGGLFVLTTFLPQNSRVERQAFGRSARKGLPGSGQLVVNLQNVSSMLIRGSGNTMQMKEMRDDLCRWQLAQLEEEDVQEVMLKEKLFQTYCTFLKEIRSEIYLLTKDVTERELMVGALNEMWATWLQKVTEEIDNKTVKDKDSLMTNLQTECKQARDKLLSRLSPTGNIYHVIKFGNEMIFDGEFDQASEFFTQCIKLDSGWATFAYYARAFCSITTRPKELTSPINDLNGALTSLLNYEQTLKDMLALMSTWPKGRTTTEDGLCHQLHARAQILQAYKKNIEECIKKLEDIKSRNKEAEAVRRDVFSLIPDADKITQEELYQLCELGLLQTYSVREKPSFTWAALVAALLGILQILAGAIICVFSLGMATSFGTALIQEGVSDVIEGVKGMITGAFDWAEWAIAKAISIATTLVTFGVSKIIKNGLQEGWRSIKESVSRTVKGLKQVPQTIAKQGFNATTKTALKVTGKIVVRELTQSGVMKLVSFGEEKLLDLLKDLINAAVRKSISQKLHDSFKNGLLNEPVSRILRSEKYQQSSDDAAIANIFQLAVSVFDSFLSIPEWQIKLSDTVFEIMNNLKKEHNQNESLKNIITFIEAVEFGNNVLTCVNRISEIVVELDTRIRQKLLKYYEIEQLTERKENCDENRIENLKFQISERVADVFSLSISDYFHQKTTRIIFRKAQSQLNGALKNTIGEKILKIKDLNDQLKNIVDPSKANTQPVANSAETSPAIDHSKAIQSEQNNGTVFDLRVLSEKFSLSVHIMQKLVNGQLQSITKIVPKFSAKSKTVTIILKRSDGNNPAGIDGKITGVETKNKTCMLLALAKAAHPEASDSDLKLKTLEYRRAISDSMLQEPSKWNEYVARRAQSEELALKFPLKAGAQRNSENKNKRLTMNNFKSSAKANEELIQALERWSPQKEKDSKINVTPVTMQNEPGAGPGKSALGKAMSAVLAKSNTGDLDFVKLRVFTDDQKKFLADTQFAPNVTGDLINLHISSNNIEQALKIACISSTSTFDRVAASPKKLSEEFKRKIMIKEIPGFKNIGTIWYEKLQEYDSSLFTRSQLEFYHNWVENLGFCDPKDEAVKAVMDKIRQN